MIKDEYIDQVRLRAKIEDVVKESGVTLKTAGSKFKCCCPFHSERTPSFVVDPAKNTWHCYGQCQEGGDAISYVMKKEALSFIDAVKYLANRYGVEIEEEKESTEQQQARLKREAMYLLNDRVRKYFASQLLKSKEPLQYIESRFSPEYVREANLGYAPDSFSSLYEWAKKKNENIDFMIHLGLLKRKEETGKIYDAYRNRIMFPIIDRNGKVIGFTGRTLNKEEEKGSKYINSCESDIYHKNESVYGIFDAKYEARKKDFFYCVEGSPDASKMQSVGILNAVAPLGGEWTEKQLQLLKYFASSVCFINDADVLKDGERFPTGINLVMKNGRKALIEGLNVSVRELRPLKKGKQKNDPGDFFTSMDALNDNKMLLPQEDFIVWYAKKIFPFCKSANDRTAAIKDVACLMSYVKDETHLNIIFNDVNTHCVRNKALLQDCLSKEQFERRKEKNKAEGSEIDYETYGFVIRKGGYFANGRQWSNFTMKPLFHVKDSDNPRRLFLLKNDKNQKDLVELTMDELISVANFQKKVEGIGTYLWEAGSAELIKLRKYLYENTKTAVSVKQMGYNPRAGYVFGNGIWNDEFFAADENGVVNTGKENNWYIPAAHESEGDSDMRFERERRFVFQKLVPVTLHEYLKDFCQVFGDNGKVGIAYWICSLFHDIVVGTTRKFPILNLFGPKGTGKSEMGQALMAFFGAGNKAPNVRNSTPTALNNDISLYSNALWHGDEYKNDVKPIVIEFLKGLYDGVGRTKMGGSAYDERIMTRVKCGIILSGQEMPTADIALFSRCVFLQFLNSKFSKEEGLRFDALFEINKMGLTHLTVDVLKHRKYFEIHYQECINDVINDIRQLTDYNSLETRIIENWARLAAAIKCLGTRLNLPFSYEEYLQLTVEGLVNQCALCGSQDELAQFWRDFEFLIDNGRIYKESDFKIAMLSKLKTVEVQERIFPQPTRVLYLNKRRVFHLYKQSANQLGDKSIPIDSLTHYLEHCPQFLGHKDSVRFKLIINGVQQMKEESTGKFVPDERVLRAMAFDYDALMKQYNIQLHDKGATVENQAPPPPPPEQTELDFG